MLTSAIDPTVHFGRAARTPPHTGEQEVWAANPNPDGSPDGVSVLKDQPLEGYRPVRIEKTYGLSRSVSAADMRRLFNAFYALIVPEKPEALPRRES